MVRNLILLLGSFVAMQSAFARQIPIAQTELSVLSESVIQVIKNSGNLNCRNYGQHILGAKISPAELVEYSPYAWTEDTSDLPVYEFLSLWGDGQILLMVTLSQDKSQLKSLVQINSTLQKFKEVPDFVSTCEPSNTSQ